MIKFFISLMIGIVGSILAIISLAGAMYLDVHEKPVPTEFVTYEIVGGLMAIIGLFISHTCKFYKEVVSLK